STFGDDTARARRSDPITSHEASDTNDVSRSIGWVLSTLLKVGPLADHQIEEIAHRRGVKFTGQRLRTARAALVRQGKVTESGEYRHTPNGRRAVVWALTEKDAA